MSNRLAALRIIRKLRQHGHEALLAGGCVRDMLLGRRPSDYDVATDARPEQVIRLFKRTLKVGAKFGVVIVMIGDKQVEVATFRTETDYTDGRHPRHVRFASAAEDAQRRDFTINGMFYDPFEDKVLDFVGGQEDLRRRLVRTIGQPAQRFAEDYLRMLRAIRFSTKLGFSIDPATWQAVRAHADRIQAISRERICMELEGILAHPNRATGASLLFESGLAQAIFAGLCSEQAELTAAVLGQLPSKVGLPLALAGFFVPYPTDKALQWAGTLKLSRSQNKHLKFLLAHRGRLLDEKISLADLRRLLAEPYFWDLYALQRAIQKATGQSLSPLRKLRRRIKALGDIEFKPKPLLNGHDLIRLGAVPGPTLGQLAEEMYTAQLEGQLSSRPQAKQWVLQWLKEHRCRED